MNLGEKNGLKRYSFFYGKKFTASPKIHLIFPLTRKALDLIEKERNGGDVRFRIDLYLAGDEVKDLTKKETKNLKELGRHLDEMEETNYKRIAMSDWIDFLDTLGYREYELLELPIHEQIPDSLRKAVGKLEEARDRYRGGNWSETLANCDDVFNRLGRALKENENPLGKKLSELMIGDKLNDLKDLIEKKTSEDEEGIRPKDFGDFSEKYKHEVAEQVAGRRDAELALHITSAFLRYFGMRITEEG